MAHQDSSLAQGTTGDRIAVIADDDEFFRLALAAVLTRSCGIDRVVQTGSYDEAAAAIAAETRVAIALFDLDMPGMTGPAALHHLRETCPHLDKVAVVSASRARDDMLATLAAGAHGFVCKASGVTELQEGIAQILHDRIYLPAMVADLSPTDTPPAARRAASLADGATADIQHDAVPQLSPRQSHVLEMLVRGKSNKEIARELNLGAGTVKVHMAALFSKLGVPNRAAAAVAGTRILTCV